MRFFIWRHSTPKKTVIISKEHHDTLEPELKKTFLPTHHMAATHMVDNFTDTEDNPVTLFSAIEEMAELSYIGSQLLEYHESSSPDIGSNSDDTTSADTFGGFGDGDTGGGGAGSDY